MRRWNGLALEVLHQRLGRVLQVVVLLLLDPALVARLRPAALVVLAEDHVVDLLDLAQALGGAAEDARVAAAHEGHAPALAALEPRQRPDERRAPDRHAAGHRPRQGEHLEQAGRVAGEDGHGLRPLGREVALQQRRRALEAGVEVDPVLVRRARRARGAAARPRRAGSGPRSRAPAAWRTGPDRGPGRGSARWGGRAGPRPTAEARRDPGRSPACPVSFAED